MYHRIEIISALVFLGVIDIWCQPPRGGGESEPFLIVSNKGGQGGSHISDCSEKEEAGRSLIKTTFY